MKLQTLKNMNGEFVEFNCPLCEAVLFSTPGHQLSATEGVTVYCVNENCSAQEVFGHGRNEKEALEIIQDRYKKE